MKIFVYDVDFQSSGNKYPLQKAFQDLGHEAQMFDWQTYLYSYKAPHIINRVRDRFLFDSVAKKVNEAFTDLLSKHYYDLILIVRGDHLYPESIDLAKERAKVVVNWNSDDLFNKVMTTKHILNSFTKYHLHLSARKHLQDEYLSKGAQNFEVIDWYYRPELSFSKLQLNAINYQNDICFIGSWSKRRENIILSLSDFQMQLAGWGWRKKLNLNQLPKWNVQNHIRMTDMAKIFSETKININILTIENRDQTNFRNFEIPACGGFQISERSDQLLELFKEDIEIVCFSSADELLDKCKFYLRNENARQKIAIAGYKKVTEGKNTTIDRVNTIIELIKKNINRTAGLN